MTEARWIADHGFLGMYMPGFLAVPGQPPLDDSFWDPLWALCSDRSLGPRGARRLRAGPGLRLRADR